MMLPKILHIKRIYFIIFFQKLNLHKVTEEQNITLRKPIAEEEIHDHINKLKLHKSPGGDGHTNEFF